MTVSASISTSPQPQADTKAVASLRDATVADVGAIVSLGREVFGGTFAHTVSATTMDEYLDSTYTPALITQELEDPHRHTILAIIPPPLDPTILHSSANTKSQSRSPTASSDQRVVGFMILATNTTEPCLAPYPNAMELQRIYTHPSTHGTGLAKRLALEAETIARTKGYEYTWLGVLPENARAVGFYKKMGYVKVGEHEFRVGSHVDVDDVMVKKLTGGLSG